MGTELNCPGDEVDHLAAGLAGLDAPRPGLFGRFELAQRRRQRARGDVAELVAADAAVILDRVEPIGLLGFFRDVALAAELIGARDLEHRVPIDRRIILRGRRIVRRRHGGQVELLAGIGIDHGGIDQAVAAHPHL